MLRVSLRRGSASLRRLFAVAPGIALEGLDLASIPPSRMVTFSIVAHVDHGKSSLSQKLLERAGNVAVERGVGLGARKAREASAAARSAASRSIGGRLKGGVESYVCWCGVFGDVRPAAA